MMTDKETVKSMLERAGIEYVEESLALRVEGGYTGFYTVYEFNAEGALVSVGAFE